MEEDFGTFDNLRVLRFDDLSIDWARFVYLNREDPEFKHDYDIVVGPVADDDLRLQFRRIKNLEISFEELARMIKNHNRYIQYCFCTESAVKLLKKI